MANVVFDKVTKIYSNGFEAVHSIDLEVKDGEFMVMVGPSGCAKSTTLRMLAGLETISGGTITIGDKVVNNLAPKDRGIAMVFQNYALYPHMTVRDNLGFGLRLAGLDKKVIEEYVDEAAELLEITPLLDRLPRQLSGGQAQRVAVGRAIVKKPVVFLFDEPLSNLDAKLRASMRVRISDLHKRLKQSNKPATTVYVTHDQTEAMTMGDRICVLKDGHIYQVDTPSNLYKYPKNLFVAGFIGAPEMNLVETTINSEGDSTYLQFTGAKLKLNPEKSKKISDRAHSSNVVLGVRPEFISLANPEDLADTIIDATVTRLENMGSEYYVHIDLEGKPMCSRIPTAIVEERLLGSEGTIKSFYLDMAHCHIFDKESEENISL